MSNERAGNWLQTYTGVQFWPLDPQLEEINIEDIAHALALTCRFNGHCKSFYSVAQHSWSVSYMVEDEHALWGLLHDASEAYLVDLPRPIKRLPEFAFYRRLEQALMARICDRFGLPLDEPAAVAHADAVMLATEKRDLLIPEPAPWTVEQGRPAAPRQAIITPYDPMHAKELFMIRFRELMGAR